MTQVAVSTNCTKALAGPCWALDHHDVMVGSWQAPLQSLWMNLSLVCYRVPLSQCVTVVWHSLVDEVFITQENQPDVLNFNSILLSRAQVSEQATSCDKVRQCFLIALKNIRLWEERSLWTKSPCKGTTVDHGCLTALLHPKFQVTYFCCLREGSRLIPELQFLHKDW